MTERDERRRMVATQIEARGIRHPAVLGALRIIPRHRFVPARERALAYHDGPVAIGFGQTISQPYIVALMTELIRPDRSQRVLEVGTGSGYQAAVLAECVGEVFSLEIREELASSAVALLDDLGYRNVRIRTGDGWEGWRDEAPFDAMVVTAAPERVPPALVDQLVPGGRLVIPVGSVSQDLVVVTKTEDGFDRKTITSVRFVPMTGKPTHNL